MVRFVENTLLFNQLNILRADVACELENGVGEAAPSTQPVTVYITINITPPNPYNSPPSIQTKNDNSLAKEATIPECIQLTAPEYSSPPLLGQQTVGADNTTPQSREEMSPTDTKNSRLAIDQADQIMTRIIPVDRSTWQTAVGRIKWVMDTLGPLAAVRIIPFCCPYLS